MRHELGHDMVAKGEISIKKVIKRLTELVGEENVAAVLDNYAEAYGKTGLNEAEIWEEIVCDSLGDMNIFAGDKVISEFMAPMLKDIKQATQETKGEANQTRGSPVSKSLYNNRDGKGGWGKVYGTAQEALNDAIKTVDSKLWDAFENEANSGKSFTPITNAIIAVQQDVRQDTITPIQGAKLLSEVYQKGGAKALDSLYIHETGNLYPKALERAKQYSTSAGEVTEGKASRETVPKRDKHLYASGVYFLHKNFPPENERLSEAHRLATLWARKSYTEAGNQTLIFMNDVCYPVECFDDALNYYQVEDVISKAEFDNIYKEIKQYGRSGQIKSVQGSFDEHDKLYKSNNSSKTGKSGIDSNEARHGRKNSKLVRVDSPENKRRERSSSDRGGDSQSSSENKQKYSRELDTEYLSAVNRGDMETAQKMVDEAAKAAGYTVKAYHGTSRGDRVGNVFLPERATSGPNELNFLLNGVELMRKKPELIKTERLLLRSMADADCEDVCGLLTNKDIAKTYMIPDFHSQEEVVKLFNRLKALSEEPKRFVYGIDLNGRLIGFINDVEINGGNIELGFVIHPEHQNCGYATEVLTCAIAMLHDMGYAVVKTGVFECNPASQHVMEKAGMQKLNDTEEIEYRGMIHRCFLYESRGK